MTSLAGVPDAGSALSIPGRLKLVESVPEDEPAGALPLIVIDGLGTSLAYVCRTPGAHHLFVTNGSDVKEEIETFVFVAGLSTP